MECDSAHNEMTEKTHRKIKTAAFVLGGMTVFLLRLWLYDDVQRQPKQFHPPLLFFLSLMGFFLLNILGFAWNVFKSLASVRGSKDEKEVENVMEPAFRGHIKDQTILRFMQIPVLVSFGVIAASTLILLAFIVRGECWGTFDGYITFANNSDTELQAVTVSGFARRPPAGVIAPGSRKRGSMPRMTLPVSVTITWRQKGTEDQRATVPLTSVPKCVTRGEIRFDYAGGGKWSVSYDPVLK
jgi:hypothetical protein